MCTLSSQHMKEIKKIEITLVGRLFSRVKTII